MKKFVQPSRTRLDSSPRIGHNTSLGGDCLEQIEPAAEDNVMSITEITPPSLSSLFPATTSVGVLEPGTSDVDLERSTPLITAWGDDEEDEYEGFYDDEEDEDEEDEDDPYDDEEDRKDEDESDDDSESDEFDDDEEEEDDDDDFFDDDDDDDDDEEDDDDEDL